METTPGDFLKKIKKYGLSTRASNVLLAEYGHNSGPADWAAEVSASTQAPEGSARARWADYCREWPSGHVVSVGQFLRLLPNSGKQTTDEILSLLRRLKLIPQDKDPREIEKKRALERVKRARAADIAAQKKLLRSRKFMEQQVAFLGGSIKWTVAPHAVVAASRERKRKRLKNWKKRRRAAIVAKTEEVPPPMTADELTAFRERMKGLEPINVDGSPFAEPL